jgi:hypothetical protein
MLKISISSTYETKMFQSYSFRYAYKDVLNNDHCLITIVDPDFGSETIENVIASQVWETDPATTTPAWAGWPEAIGLIQIYSKRNYSVNQIAKNLWLLFEHNRRINGWEVFDQIKWCLKYAPKEYQPYHETIQMLMLFS